MVKGHKYHVFSYFTVDIQHHNIFCKLNGNSKIQKSTVKYILKYCKLLDCNVIICPDGSNLIESV